MARGSGLFWDLRKTMPYEKYDLVDFLVPIGMSGDCFDRFLLRVEEMRQSVKIIMQLVLFLLKFELGSGTNVGLFDFGVQSEIERVLEKFTFFSGGSRASLVCSAFQSKGEFGAFLVGDCFSMPLRCKIKSPGFSHLQGVDFMSRGLLLADVVTLIGTQDVVFGEIDR